jgi:hypothetical protein
VCAFFNSEDEKYRVLLQISSRMGSSVRQGGSCRDPDQRHNHHGAPGTGIDIWGQESGQLELRTNVKRTFGTAASIPADARGVRASGVDNVERAFASVASYATGLGGRWSFVQDLVEFNRV